MTHQTQGGSAPAAAPILAAPRWLSEGEYYACLARSEKETTQSIVEAIKTAPALPLGPRR